MIKCKKIKKYTLKKFNEKYMYKYIIIYNIYNKYLITND